MPTVSIYRVFADQLSRSTNMILFSADIFRSVVTMCPAVADIIPSGAEIISKGADIISKGAAIISKGAEAITSDVTVILSAAGGNFSTLFSSRTTVRV